MEAQVVREGLGVDVGHAVDGQTGHGVDEVGIAPRRDLGSEDDGGVPGVLGDEVEGVEGAVVRVAVLDQLEGDVAGRDRVSLLERN